MRRAWSQKIKNNEKDGNFLLLFVAFFLVAFVYFNIPQPLLSENGNRNNITEDTHAINGDEGLFLSYNNIIRDTGNFSFTDGNFVFTQSAPYFTTASVFGTEIKGKRENLISYRVEEGDSLSSIADKFNISTDTIKWANNIKANNVKEGDELLILPITGVMYYVEKGDTTGSIAQLHKISVEEVISFNNIEGKNIIAGDRLIIPNGTPPPPPPPPPPPTRTASSKTINTSSHSGPVVVSGNFINPVPGGMITQSTHPYNAVDIYNHCGKPILASASGVVTEIGRGAGSAGNFVKIDHGSVVVLYAHMQSIYVVSGQQVGQGSQIGTVGNTGRTIGRTGCHLHFDFLSRKISNPFSRFPTGTRL